MTRSIRFARHAWLMILMFGYLSAACNAGQPDVIQSTAPAAQRTRPSGTQFSTDTPAAPEEEVRGTATLLSDDQSTLQQSVDGYLPAQGPVGTLLPLPPDNRPVGPTPTPVSLDPDGPWLLGRGPGGLVAFNADGTQRTALTITEPRDPYFLEDGLSAQAGWIAFRTGEAEEAPTPLYLTMLRFPFTKPSYSIPLFSDELASSLRSMDWLSWASDDVSLAVDTDGFWATLMWSPNGRYLAFVGALDGPSADVYVFDTQSEAILRLTDGPNQPRLLGWSPDNRWVVHLELTDLELGHGLNATPLAVWAADVMGGPALRVLEAVGGFGDGLLLLGWRSERVALFAEVNPFGHVKNMHSVDLQTWRRITLFEGEVLSVAADPVSGAVAYTPFVNPYPRGHSPSTGGGAYLSPPPLTGDQHRQASDLEGGVYLIPPGQLRSIRLDLDDWREVQGPIRWLPGLGRFYVGGERDYLFSPTGELSELPATVSVPKPSPQGGFYAIAVQPGGGRDDSISWQIHSLGSGLVLDLSAFGVVDLLWDEVGQGMYLLTEQGSSSQIAYLRDPSSRPEELNPDARVGSFVSLVRAGGGP